MSKFQINSPFSPTGDQPKAIEKIIKNIKNGAKHQVLLGVTGSGKTFTMANVIERIQQPTLVISHNKTLAAQLYQEFKDFFPNNEVHYFVSYYDYYQPEAYIPQTDTYIEKDSKINEEIDRLRHAATQALLSRRDTIIVASVSCIYNIGSPKSYIDLSFEIKKDQTVSRQQLLRQLTSLQFSRNDINFARGTFRARGSIVEIWPSTGEKIIKIELDGQKILKIKIRQIKNIADIFSNEETEQISERIYPAKFWVSPLSSVQEATDKIKNELQQQLKELKKTGKILEAERLRRRTNFDLEMMKETGYCHGMENYSSHLESRPVGSPPSTLLDYFYETSKSASKDAKRSEFKAPSASKGVRYSEFKVPDTFLTIIDESHMTIPQIGGMYFGDQSRKKTLVDFGFRLPSALDNRPLKFAEFEKKVGQTIYVSATPGKYEMEKSSPSSPLLQKRGGGNLKPYVVEQLIRPTGLLDPQISVRPTTNQIPDLIAEIKKRVKKNQRVLVTTLTKRMSEDLTEYLTEAKIKTQYLHSEIKTLERPEILRALREGKYDVVVGVNLLREGLDLPEVSLVAILDADKEGFLRNATTLIQTIGRASRHLEGQVIMYADKITRSMKQAIEETDRRRHTQENYNKKHGLIPQTIKKAIRADVIETKPEAIKAKSKLEYLKEYIKELEDKAELANRNLQFDEATKIKEEINKLKKIARQQSR